MQIGDLSAGSLLKLGLVSGTMFWGVFGLFFGLIALTGGPGIYWNGQPVYGITGLILAMVSAAAFAVVTAMIVMLGGLLARLIPPLRRVRFSASEFKDLPQVAHPED